MKKFLLIACPTMGTHFPEMAIPALTAQLRKNNYDVSVMDLNIDFFYYIYNKNFLENSIKKAKEQYIELEKNKETFYNAQDNEENKILAKKYDELKDFFENHMAIAKEVPSSIEKALQIVRNEKLFYNPKLLHFAHKLFLYANKIACLPYAPFDFYSTYETYYEDSCKKIIFNRDRNIFIEYFEQKLEEIKNINADFIGISVSYAQQHIAGLTLSNMLKKQTNAHINIGGNFFTRLRDYIPNYKDFFEIFTDSISLGEGENSVIELAKYVEGKIDISKVPQLIYQDKKTGEVKLNNSMAKVILSRVQPPDYSDYDLSKYLLPEKILPLHLQRGCYWNKCTFCASAYAKTPGLKKMDQIIAELKHYIEKYDVRYFMIIDEAVTPNVLEKFSNEIIKNKLDVRFLVQAKLEKAYDEKLLKKMYDAGFRNIWWGLESANERVQNLMNKGVSTKNFSNIIGTSDKVGIFNSVYCLFGFPTATYEEDMETCKFVEEHSEIVHLFFTSIFGPLKYSPIYNHPEEFKIKIKEDSSNSRISVFYDYESDAGMTSQEKKEIERHFTEYHDRTVRYVFAPIDYFLYCNRLGLEYIKDNILNIRK